MKLYKKVLILIFLVAFLISGFYVVNNYIINNYSPQSASSTVYIENGVSGTVTITDPFLNKAVDVNIEYYPLDAGSGVIVTNNGYIITAFHVVSDPQALNNHQVLKMMDDNNIKLYLEQGAVTYYLSKYNPQLGDELLNNNSIANPGNLNTNISVLTGLLIQNNLINVKSGAQVIKVNIPSSRGITSFKAQLIDVGNSASDEDIALLKINPTTNLLALNISSQKPTIGESVRIYGYPSNEMRTQLVTPSTTTGQLTGTSLNLLYTTYYQTNAHTAPGYSGGPVLNPQNRVIGILIYGIESRGHFRQQIESQSSLFLSSSYIIQICAKNNVPINVV